MLSNSDVGCKSVLRVQPGTPKVVEGEVVWGRVEGAKSIIVVVSPWRCSVLAGLSTMNVKMLCLNLTGTCPNPDEKILSKDELILF